MYHSFAKISNTLNWRKRRFLLFLKKTWFLILSKTMLFAYIHDKRHEIMKWPIVIVLKKKYEYFSIIYFQFSIGKMKKIIIQHIIPGNIDKRRFLIIILSDTTSKIMKKDFCLFSRISFFIIYQFFKFKKKLISWE